MLPELLLFALATLSSATLDSRNIARHIKNGDHKAFKKFFEAHHDTLFHFLIAKGITQETAQDLIQQAFVYIWEHRQNINPEKSLRAYLFRIGYTRMLNHIRDSKKFDADTLPTLEFNHTPEDQLRTKELHDAIKEAVKTMPKKRGLVFEICFIQEFTYREAAETLDITKKTVENHMGLALKDLRSALSDFI